VSERSELRILLRPVLAGALLLLGINSAAISEAKQTALMEKSATPQSVDPTRPPSAKPARKTVKPKSRTPRYHWRLSSTLVSEDRRSAIIDGHVVGTGDHIHGALVMEIQPSLVRIRRQGRVITLTLAAKDIKRPGTSRLNSRRRHTP